MKEWKVLPTDPRFLELTSEQKDFLWDNFLIDNPEIEKKLKNRFDDEEFDEEWDKLDEDTPEDSQEHSQDVVNSSEGNSDSEGFETEIKAYESFLNERKDLELPDVYERLRAKGIKIEKPTEEEVSHIPNLVDTELIDDWEEEVDD